MIRLSAVGTFVIKHCVITYSRYAHNSHSLRHSNKERDFS